MKPEYEVSYTEMISAGISSKRKKFIRQFHIPGNVSETYLEFIENDISHPLNRMGVNRINKKIQNNKIIY